VSEDQVPEGGVEDVPPPRAQQDDVDPVVRAGADERSAGPPIRPQGLEQDFSVGPAGDARDIAERRLDRQLGVLRAPPHHAGRTIRGESLEASELGL
jgi:hypothetical protein